MSAWIRPFTAVPLPVIAGPLLALALCGCGPTARRAPAPTRPAPRHSTAGETPSNLNARGFSGRWQEKTPAGGVQRVMDIQAETGSLNAQTQSGTLYRAHGLLYREDRARARFEAPIVEAHKDRGVVVARGGVRVVSIAPAGTTLTAKQVTWHIERDVIVAEGDVSFEQRPPGARRPVAWGGPFPHVTANTELRRLTIP